MQYLYSHYIVNVLLRDAAVQNVYRLLFSVDLQRDWTVKSAAAISHNNLQFDEIT